MILDLPCGNNHSTEWNAGWSRRRHILEKYLGEEDPFPHWGCFEMKFEPLSSMACCLQIPDTKALSFLQETAQLLSQPEPISSSTPGRPERQAGLAMCPRRNARVSSGDGSPAALASFGPLDALSLISLHCSNLESEPVDRIERTEAKGVAQESSSGILSKDCPVNRLWTACVEEPKVAQQQGAGASHKTESQRGRRRASRKQPRPRRSCEPLDPSFQGVTFQMQLHQHISKGCRLVISPRYSSGKLRKRSRTPLAREECKAGSSEEEEGCPSIHRNKRCASCKTRKTPLWRDAEDGTPLCNACGIRYKKYRIRCFRCWNIPKHGGKPYPHCSTCGGKLRVVTAQQKSGKRCGSFLRLCS
ncbi:GATA-type zinc finger protein 1 isoform X2 [Rhineura floridana]|uniref:GATA-type zinc finger protein 1 isoform X2 n=1 Tax=Rhineura floridana TaxID=261503 RepID=UPI002AC81149|nr:GATA-type zinc finger protein 1 isoform X2 [Rhineura floridana]